MNYKLLNILIVIAIAIIPMKALALQENDIKFDLLAIQRVAVADNPSLKAANKRIIQANEKINQAKAKYLPVVDAKLSTSKNRISENAASIYPTLERTTNNNIISINGSLTLFDGFARKFGELAAKSAHMGAKAARQDGQRLLLQLVADSYYQAQLINLQIDIAKADQEFNEHQLKNAEEKYKYGNGSLSTVLNYQIKVNNSKSDLINAQYNLQSVLCALASLMGQIDCSLAESSLVKLPIIKEKDFKKPNLDTLVAKAMDNRPDLWTLVYGLASTESQYEKARAVYYPKISLKGTVDSQRKDDLGFNEDYIGTSISMNLTYNLFKGYADKSKIAEAYAAKMEVSDNIEKLKQKISAEVCQSLTSLEKSQKRYLIAQQTVNLVHKNRNLVKAGYNQGKESLERLNSVQRDLVKIRLQSASAMIELYKARHYIKTVTGQQLGKH